MDVLSDILDAVELKGQLYFSTRFSGEWSVAVPDLRGAARFHLLLVGECWISVGGDEPLRLAPGDLALIPGGAPHVLASAPRTQGAPLETVLRESGYTGEGPLIWNLGPSQSEARLLCGHFTFAEGAQHPLLQTLPRKLHLSVAERSSNAALNDVLALLQRRVSADFSASAGLVRRLSEIMFIEIVRTAVGENAFGGAMGPLGDRAIARAIAAMHKDLARDWSVEALAAEAALSRSRFAERFQELIGRSPLAYLSEWRMQRARHLLSSTNARIQEVSASVGYASPAAFARAFAQSFGLSPKDYRKRLRPT